MKCLKQGSWLRSMWKAFPFGPQFACALGAPTHTCMLTPTNAHRFNQPNQQKLRQERRANRGDAQLGLCHQDPSESQEQQQPFEQNQCFHSSILFKSKKERHKTKASTASILVIHPVLFIGKTTTMWSRNTSKLRWKSPHREWVILIAILNFLRTSWEQDLFLFWFFDQQGHAFVKIGTHWSGFPGNCYHIWNSATSVESQLCSQLTSFWEPPRNWAV